LPNPYDRIAPRYAAARKPWLEQRYLPALIEGLTPGDRVLDLGCGAGLPITSRRGYPPDEVGDYLRAAGLGILTQELDEPFDKGHVSFVAARLAR
jgi:SAM-dependent methyltransferase